MSFYTSLSGLQASQTEMATISHNLANVGTNGFKRSRTEFADVIASSVSLSPTQMVGSGTVVKANRQQFGQGNLIQSANTLDLAISGDGFFAVKPDMGSSKVNFTRNGGFQVDNDRYVVDAQGAHLQVYPVDGSGAVVATGIDAATSLRLPSTSGTAKATGAVTMSAMVPRPGKVRTGAPLAVETDSTGAQTRLVAATALPPFCAAAATVNGPGPASAPVRSLPSQSYCTVPAFCAPSAAACRIWPRASLIVTVTSDAAAPSSTAPASPPVVRP